MAKKFKKVLVPATTTNKQKLIIGFLLKEGHSASRINTTGIYNVETQSFRKTGARVGFSDITGVLKSRFNFPSGKIIGIPIFIEGKFTKSDELSVEQIEFRDEVIAAGGLHLECESVDQFYKWYLEIKEEYL